MEKFMLIHDIIAVSDQGKAVVAGGRAEVKAFVNPSSAQGPAQATVTTIKKETTEYTATTTEHILQVGEMCDRRVINPPVKVHYKGPPFDVVKFLESCDHFNNIFIRETAPNIFTIV
jgi:hypothetical protein